MRCCVKCDRRWASGRTLCSCCGSRRRIMGSGRICTFIEIFMQFEQLMSTQKSTRTKQCHSHYPNEKQDTEHTCISLNQAYWKPSCEITAGLSWKNLKKYESKAARNIRPAVKNTIPGIGTGNYCTITRICVLSRVSMIFLKGTFCLSSWDVNWNASVSFCSVRGFCGKRRLKSGSALILTAGRSNVDKNETTSCQLNKNFLDSMTPNLS